MVAQALAEGLVPMADITIAQVTVAVATNGILLKRQRKVWYGSHT